MNPSWDSQQLSQWAGQYAEGNGVVLDGHVTHYREMGEGEPVILLHGYMFDSHYWDPNIEVLADHFKVYAPDWWGCGFSSRQPMDYGYPLFARQLLLFMNALDISSATLIGHSFGAGAAIQFSIENRQRVNKLVLVSAGGLKNPPPLTSRLFCLPGIGELLASLPGYGLKKSILERFWFYRKDVLTDTYLEVMTRSQKIKGTTRAALNILRRNFFDKLEDQITVLGMTDIPTLIVWGRQDKGIPVDRAERMHRLLPQSQLKILEYAGHAVSVEAADSFNELCLDFLLERRESPAFAVA